MSTQRGLLSRNRSQGGTGTNHLFLIAIDEYKHHPILNNAVSDGEKLKEVLLEKYEFENFDVKFIKNHLATRRNIIKTLIEYAPNPTTGRKGLAEEDTLVIVFLGHGSFNKDQGIGYWIPVDSESGELGELDNISNDLILRYINPIKAHRIIIVVDACFGGSLIDSEISVGQRNMSRLPSPYVITSGRVQVVEDGTLSSPFMDRFIKILRANEKKVLFLDEIGRRVNTDIPWETSQTPLNRQLSNCGIPTGPDHFFFRSRKNNHVGTRLSSENIAKAEIDISRLLREGSNRRYLELKEGRFQFLEISNLIIPGASLRFINADVKLTLKSNIREDALLESKNKIWKTLLKIWATDQKNALIMGNGGMGKTVNCVRLWELLNGFPTAPIPLFISLNEYNTISQARDSKEAPLEEKFFIRNYINQHYLKTYKRNATIEEALWKFLGEPNSKGRPVVILFLDGLNEVTRDKGWLEKELKDLIERCKGIQVVVTSRYDLRGFTMLQNFSKIDLLDLENWQKEIFLKEAASQTGHHLPLPTNKVLLDLLGNPMMLTLYALTGGTYGNSLNDKRIRLFKQVGSTGELLWNFVQAQLAKQLDACQYENQAIWCEFLINFLLPSIAYEMEKKGVFIIPEGAYDSDDSNMPNLEKIVENSYSYFESNERFFFQSIPTVS